MCIKSGCSCEKKQNPPLRDTCACVNLTAHGGGLCLQGSRCFARVLWDLLRCWGWPMMGDVLCGMILIVIAVIVAAIVDCADETEETDTPPEPW